MEIPEQIWLLIARNLSGEATENEQKKLSELLREDEQLHQHYDLLTRIWVVKQNSLQNEDESSAKDAVSRIISKAEKEEEEESGPLVIIAKPLIKRGRVWMAAASVIIIALSGWLLLGNQSSSTEEEKQAVIESQKGSRTRSVLADGSTVWLNAGSKLYYENDFTGATREVKLEGEAFFDIVKKPDHPFIVHTSGIDIKVLGTSFNVKSYPEDKNVVTTLYRGSVKVYRHEETEANAVQLEPYKKVEFPKDAVVIGEASSELSNGTSPVKQVSKKPPIVPIDSTQKESERKETAWVYDRLEFDGDKFEEMAIKLERWYNVKIHFTDEKVKQEKLQLSYVDKETVAQFFVQLKAAFPMIDYKMKDREIYIGYVK